MIDAGHGGKDCGAKCQGKYEKDIVLQIAKKVKEEFEEKETETEEVKPKVIEKDEITSFKIIPNVKVWLGYVDLDKGILWQFVILFVLYIFIFYNSWVSKF